MSKKKQRIGQLIKIRNMLTNGELANDGNISIDYNHHTDMILTIDNLLRDDGIFAMAADSKCEVTTINKDK